MRSYQVVLLLSILLAAICQPIKAADEPTESKITESSIRAHLKSLEDADISDAKAQKALLGSYMRFADENNLPGLEASVAAELASIEFSQGHLSVAEKLVSKFLPLARESNEANALISFYYLKSKIADRRSQPEQAFGLGEQMLDLAIAANNDSKIADAYILLGQLLTRVNRYKEALSYLQKALIIVEGLDDPLGVSIVNSSIASIYGSLNEQQKAIEYYQRALVYLQASGERFNESIVLFNIGLAYLILEDDEKAKHYLKRAMEISETLDDDLGVAYAKTRLAKIESQLGNYELAITYLQDALPIFKKADDLRMVYVSQIALVRNFAEDGQHEKAQHMLLPLKEVAKKLNSIDFEILYFLALSESKSAAGDFKAAYLAGRNYAELLQQQHEQEKEKSLTEMRIKFDTLQKEKENRLLIQENQLKQLKLSEQQTSARVNYLIMTLIALVAIVIAILLLKQVQLRKMYKRMAMRDELTGAYNRRAIMEFAKRRMLEARAEGGSFTLAMLDLDLFKQINDNYGHDVGDEVLKVFAQAAQAAIRAQDRLGRIGGEEWLYVLPDTDPQYIEVIFQRVNQQLAKVHIIGLPRDHKITFSMGVASASPSQRKLEDIIKLADNRLYRAKEKGRNQYVA